MPIDNVEAEGLSKDLTLTLIFEELLYAKMACNWCYSIGRFKRTLLTFFFLCHSIWLMFCLSKCFTYKLSESEGPDPEGGGLISTSFIPQSLVRAQKVWGQGANFAIHPRDPDVDLKL